MNRKETRREFLRNFVLLTAGTAAAYGGLKLLGDTEESVKRQVKKSLPAKATPEEVEKAKEKIRAALNNGSAEKEMAALLQRPNEIVANDTVIQEERVKAEVQLNNQLETKFKKISSIFLLFPGVGSAVFGAGGLIKNVKNSFSKTKPPST